MIKSVIKKIIPPSFLGFYHRSLSVAADFIYGRPSEKMRVIGVTGTNGKSTTAILISKILEEAGYQVGAASTVIFKVAEKEWLNDKKMTMLGRFALQKLLKEMVDAGCQYAVIETSSEGIKQFRHLGIHYDAGVFTNLTPEHLESHGGFDNYKKAKLKLFEKLEKDENKFIGSPPFQGGVRGGYESRKSQVSFKTPLNLPFERGEIIKKVIIANGDDPAAKDFLDFKVDEKIVFGLKQEYSKHKIQDTNNIQYLSAEDINFKSGGVSFSVNGVNFDLKLFGKFNVYNSLAAIAVAKSQGVSLEICQSALEKVAEVPGRMEFIDCGQPFKVLVDYAPEEASMRQLYQTIGDHKIKGGGKIIHLLGSAGGGRDKSRRPVLGKIAAANADYVIVTNEDPYDEEPNSIIDQVAQGAADGGKILNQNLFKILDRREAIKKTLSLAGQGDLVLLTGKGSEQAICVAYGKKIPWDEREVVRELLKNSEI